MDCVEAYSDLFGFNFSHLFLFRGNFKRDLVIRSLLNAWGSEEFHLVKRFVDLSPGIVQSDGKLIEDVEVGKIAQGGTALGRLGLPGALKREKSQQQSFGDHLFCLGYPDLGQDGDRGSVNKILRLWSYWVGSNWSWTLKTASLMGLYSLWYQRIHVCYQGVALLARFGSLSENVESWDDQKLEFKASLLTSLAPFFCNASLAYWLFGDNFFSSECVQRLVSLPQGEWHQV